MLQAAVIGALVVLTTASPADLGHAAADHKPVAADPGHVAAEPEHTAVDPVPVASDRAHVPADHGHVPADLGHVGADIGLVGGLNSGQGIIGGNGQYAPCKQNGQNGVCVPYYLCNDGQLVTDGAGIIDIRVGAGLECPNFLDLCCANPHVTVTPKPPVVVEYQSVCGRRNKQGIDVRIQGFGGNETQVGEFPWMSAVLKKEVVSGEEINLYLCGGSLIHPSIVMTAAHCVYKHAGVPSDLRVRLGEWDTQNEYEPYKHQDRDVFAVTLHPGFNPSNLHNDYALLYLQKPVELSRNIDVICLDNDPSILSPYHDCVVTGWGKDRFGKEGIFQNVLKQINLPYYEFYACQDALRTTRLGKFFKLDPSFVCAGGEPGKDSCSGDGGSPLVCLDKTKTQYVQVGMVAWGIGCGTANIPGVYVNVVGGYDWIVTEANKLLEGGAHKPVIDYWGYS